jgi:hypothetical protein
MSPRHPYNPCHSERSEGSAVRLQYPEFSVAGTRGPILDGHDAGMQALKRLAIAICWLLSACTAQAECVTFEPQKSSSHIRIAVVLDGKPLKDAKVVVYHVYPSSSRSYDLTTDESGIVALPELPAGTYDVSASLHGFVTSSLSLGVTPAADVSAFSIDLTDSVQRAESLPVRDQIRTFAGTVSDQSGAVIPLADILVVKKGSRLQDIVLKAEQGTDGRFSAQLPAGSYIAFFFSQGFHTAIVPFEVTKAGHWDLRIVLTIPRC